MAEATPLLASSAPRRARAGALVLVGLGALSAGHLSRRSPGGAALAADNGGGCSPTNHVTHGQPCAASMISPATHHDSAELAGAAAAAAGGAAAGGAAAASSSAYALNRSYVGPDFFDGFEFFTAVDPTIGFVNYTSRETAAARGLINATASSVYMGVDDAHLGANATSRDSVRIESTATFSSGLFVLSLAHIPTGCGVWPAFWMTGTGDAWPMWGEWDIVEGFDRQSQVFSSIHTTSNCSEASVGDDAFSGSWVLGNRSATTDCSVAHGNPQDGCSQKGPNATLGAQFNAGGGGTYAAEWTSSGLSIWFWQAGAEPADLAARAPEPRSWGTPYSFFALGPDSCDPSHFRDMRIVFDLDLCGTCVNHLYGPKNAQSFHGSCPHIIETCPEFIKTNAKALAEAYWIVTALDVYSNSSAV